MIAKLQSSQKFDSSSSPHRGGLMEELQRHNTTSNEAKWSDAAATLLGALGKLCRLCQQKLTTVKTQ